MSDVSSSSASRTAQVAGTSRNLVGFTYALARVCAWSRVISVSPKHDWDSSERFIHYYVLFWLAGLSLVLAFGPYAGWPGWIMVAIAFYRLQDLIFSTLDNALRLSDRKRWSSYDWRTPLMLALVNIVQIVLIFAVAYLVLTAQDPGSFAQPPHGRFGYFFLSWISLPPLGGGAAPLTTMARILTIGEEGTGLLIIVIAVGRFLSGPE